MANVLMPQKKNNAGIGQLLGTAAGFALGGPAGAGIGSQLGGMIGNAGNTPGPQQVGSDSAIGRRFAAQSEDPFNQLKQGVLALNDPNIPHEIKADTAKPILTAYMNEAQKRGIKNPWEGV